MKIYTGFRFVTCKTLKESYDLLKKVQPILSSRMDIIWIHNVVGYATKLYDMASITSDTDDNFLQIAYSQLLHDVQLSIKNQTPNVLDPLFEIYISPSPYGTKEIYGLINSYNKGMIKIFEENVLIEKFNVTPELNKQNEEQWKERFLLWSDIFGDNGNPESSMLKYTLVSGDPREIKNRVIREGDAYIPDIIFRANQIARAKLIHEMKQKIVETSGDENISMDDINHAISTDVFDSKVSALTSKYEKELDKSLSIKKLLNNQYKGETV